MTRNGWVTGTSTRISGAPDRCAGVNCMSASSFSSPLCSWTCKKQHFAHKYTVHERLQCQKLYCTCTKTSPLGAYWYEFRWSIFIATWSFQANSSAFCHGASVLGKRNLTLQPTWKHCHTGASNPPKDQSEGEAGASKWPDCGGGRGILKIWIN